MNIGPRAHGETSGLALTPICAGRGNFQTRWELRAVVASPKEAIMRRGAGNRGQGIALGVMLVAALVCFREAIAGAFPMLRDMVGFTIPSRFVIHEALQRHELALWNPLTSMGVSPFAAPVHGALYPGHVLLFLRDFTRGFSLTFFTHAVLASVGMYKLARFVGARPAAATLPGLLASVGGYAVSMWWNGEKVLTYAWLPWAVLSFAHYVRNARGRSLRILAPSACLAAMAAAGDPFVWFDTGLVAGAIGFGAAPPAAPLKRWLRVLMRGMAVLGLAMALAAPVLLPAFLLRTDTVRSQELSASVAEAWSMHPLRFVEFLLPNAMGNVFQLDYYGGVHLAENPEVQALPWAVSLYWGAATLSLAAMAPPSAFRKGLWLCAALGLVLALGSHSPIHALARAVVPGLALMRYPEKHIVITTVSVGLLASLGVEGFLAGGRRAGRGVGALVAAGLVLALVWRTDAYAYVGAALPSSALVLAVVVGALRIARRHPRWEFLVPLVVALDLVHGARPNLRWNVDPMPPTSQAMLRALVPAPPSFPPRFFWVMGNDGLVESMLDNAPQLYGIATVPGHDPAASVRLGRIADAFGSSPRALLSFLGVEGLLRPDATQEPGALRVERGPHLSHYALATHVLFEDDEKALDEMKARQLRLEDVAILPLSEQAHLPPFSISENSRGASGTCRLTMFQSARLTFHCDTKARTLLVLMEGYAPGWRARINGKQVPVLRTNLVYRGVDLPEGSSDVEWDYEPPGLVAGFWVAFASMVLAGLVFGPQTKRLAHPIASR